MSLSMKKSKAKDGESDPPSDKKGGMLSRIVKSSIRGVSGKKGNNNTQQQQPQGASADGSTQATPPVSPGLRKPGAGTLGCCPLTSNEYQEAWADMSAKKGMPPQRSRLHSKMETVLKDRTASNAFSTFLKTRGVAHMLKFTYSLEKIPVQTPLDKDEGGIAKAIYDKYVDPSGSARIDFPDDVTEAVKSGMGKKKMDARTIYEPAKKHVLHVLKNTHFPHFLQSQPYFKYCIDFLTSGNVVLEDILYNETALMGFMDYMGQEGAATLVQFWLILSNFKEQLREQDSKGKPVLSDAQAKSDALSLYERFFVPSAHEFLGVDEGVQAETKRVLSMDGRPKVSCFMLSQHLIYTAMRQHFFPEYLQSDIYYQYLNGLVMASESKAETSLDQKPQDGSAAKEQATDETKDEDSKSKLTGIHSRTSSMGSVDEWGVLHRDNEVCNPIFDEADRVGLGKLLKSGMKSAVGIKKRDTKAELDMAMQISRMIINDVYKEMQEHTTKLTEVMPKERRAEILLRGSLSHIEVPASVAGGDEQSKGS